MTTPEVMIIPFSEACVNLMDGGCQLPQMMGGEAAMQIFRLPSVLIHKVPGMQPGGESLGVPSCAR